MTAHPLTNAAEIEAARVLLDKLGVTLEDLAAARTGQTIPTFSQYVPVVYAAMKPGRTRDNYMSYWRKLADHWPERALDEPTVSELRSFVETVRAQRRMRRNDRHGYGVARQAVDALRALYRFAVDDGFIAELANPAQRLPRPTRLPSRRRAITSDMLSQIYDAASRTGDPALHTLILRFHTETACRRGGLLSLTAHDLDADQCLVRLKEKGQRERWQPVSPSLMEALQDHHAERMPQIPPTKARNGKPIASGRAECLLRYRNGDPVSSAVYDTLWRHILRGIPAARTHGVSAHWLRHTTLKWVERNFGRAVAKAYAGHSESTNEGSTDIYTRADIGEVARALTALTGESHPLLANTSEAASRMPETSSSHSGGLR